MTGEEKNTYVVAVEGESERLEFEADKISFDNGIMYLLNDENVRIVAVPIARLVYFYKKSYLKWRG